MMSGAMIPHRRTEERHVDHRRLAGALTVKSAGGDAARDRHAARRVAEGGALHDRLGGAGGVSALAIPPRHQNEAAS